MDPKKRSLPNLPPGWKAYESGEIRKPIPLRAPDHAPRLLVVDDDAGIRRSLQRLLGATYRVTVVEAEEALALVRSGETYDAILSDLRMPTLDGIALFRGIEEVAPALAQKMIFMTGGAERDALAFLAERGLPVLDKPFVPGDLLALVDAIVAKRDGR